jgi:hypothetical protein
MQFKDWMHAYLGPLRLVMVLYLDQWIRRKMNQPALTPMSGSFNLANHNHGLRQITMASRVEQASSWLILVRYKL